MHTHPAVALQETSENDDENVHPVVSSLQSISSFEDIQQLINTSNWVPLTIFLNFLLTDPNSDPRYLVSGVSRSATHSTSSLRSVQLFYILTEELRLRKAENRNELIRWIFEIHSTFTMHSSVSVNRVPLCLECGVFLASRSTSVCLKRKPRRSTVGWTFTSRTRTRTSSSSSSTPKTTRER